MTQEHLLKVREALKDRKPTFTKQDRHKKPRLDAGWRKPKGRHSKMREHKKGHPASVSKGWKSPVAVRHLTREGLKHIVVQNENDFLNLNANQHAVSISGKVGLRTRLILIQKAMERKITIVNLKNPEQFVQEKLQQLKQRKDVKTKKTKEKEQKKADLEKVAEKKKAEEKKSIEEAVTDEEKKKQEKEEKDKILTKKE